MTKIEELDLELKARKMVEGPELNWWDVIKKANAKEVFIFQPHFRSGVELALPKPKTVMVEMLVEDAEFLSHPAFPVINQQRVSEACRKALEELK